MCYLFQTTQRSEPQRVGQIQSQQKTGQILDQPVRQIMDQPGRQIMDRPVRQIMDQNIEQQTVRQILEKLGSGLHETELWALCAECVLTLQQSSTQALPGYVSLDTVVITDDGHVDFKEVAEVTELELIYLAPELQADGVITEKTCLFGVAVLLWLAADYKMPTNQEPALSEEFENLLISMTQDIADLRPLTSAVLQVCESYQCSQDVSSTVVCQMLAGDAHKAEAFGKTNVLVRNILDEELANEAVNQKAQLMDSIKAAQLHLKPVSDRQLADKNVKKCIHECLMEEIKHPGFKLRKCRQPRLRSVRALFQSDSRLLRGLAKVTSGGMDQSQPEGFRPSSGSAFSHVPSQNPGIGLRQKKTNDYNSVPSALNSSATHFMPIVLTPTGDVIKRREMPKIPAMSDAEREQKVARKLEELKMNVRRSQLPSHLALDLEQETSLEAKYVSELKIGKIGAEHGGSPQDGGRRSGSNEGERIATFPAWSH
ncbi:hypothetical protein LSAT2_019858 [Lamellibrachia satsuma]|nr:hypothetical protein LSAT2_019858 [Lamellibrachia satsuma]